MHVRDAAAIAGWQPAEVQAKGSQDERYRALVAALVEARKAAGLSQSVLADRLDRHQQFVSRYETG